MDQNGNAGSVAFVQGIAHPISIARAVMEKTPHVMLVGYGAELFAKSLGMEQLPNVLTDQTSKAWQEWLKEKSTSQLSILKITIRLDCLRWMQMVLLLVVVQQVDFLGKCMAE